MEGAQCDALAEPSGRWAWSVMRITTGACAERCICRLRNTFTARADGTCHVRRHRIMPLVLLLLPIPLPISTVGAAAACSASVGSLTATTTPTSPPLLMPPGERGHVQGRQRAVGLHLPGGGQPEQQRGGQPAAPSAGGATVMAAGWPRQCTRNRCVGQRGCSAWCWWCLTLR